MCRIDSLFFLQVLIGCMSTDARDFNNIQTKLLTSIFPARQGVKEKSLHSARNIRGTCTIVCHRQKRVAQ